jgi:hypothetical protein
MNACIFQEVMVNSWDLKRPKSRSLRKGYVPKLFVTDIPDEGVTAEEITRTLLQVGPHLMGTPIDWTSHVIELETKWPEEVALTWNRGHARKASWKAVVGDERRITIRLPLSLFVEVESEARIRSQSLNEFCVDALEAQLRTRSKRIERALLEHAARGSDPSGNSATLGLLFNFATSVVSDCSHTELVDGLKRLARQQYIKIRKYDPKANVFSEYSPDDTPDDFFYRGDFLLKLQDTGRPYLEGLGAAFAMNKRTQTKEKQ